MKISKRGWVRHKGGMGYRRWLHQSTTVMVDGCGEGKVGAGWKRWLVGRDSLVLCDLKNDEVCYCVWTKGYWCEGEGEGTWGEAIIVLVCFVVVVAYCGCVVWRLACQWWLNGGYRWRNLVLSEGAGVRAVLNFLLFRRRRLGLWVGRWGGSRYPFWILMGGEHK